MTRFLLIGVAALALSTGGASAQTSYSNTTTSQSNTATGDYKSSTSQEMIQPDGTQTEKSKSVQTTSPTGDPTDSSVKVKRSQKTVESDGTETERSKSYSSGGGATKQTSNVRLKAPDGSEASKHEEHTVSPDGDTTHTTSTRVER